MAYYITRPDLLLVEFQLGMVHALLILNILLMNLYYRLMLCGNIWKFFHEYWRKYRHFACWLKFIITSDSIIFHKYDYVRWKVLISSNTLRKMVIIGQSISEISQNKDEIMKLKKKIGLLVMGLCKRCRIKNMLLLL